MGEQTDMSFKTTGCAWLIPLSDLVGIPLDQVNFIVCQVFALAIGFWFRVYLSPQRAGPTLRHAVATLFGASFVIFCFGWYASHIFVLTLGCYGILCTVGPRTVHWYSMITALGYLTACQVTRVFIFNYGILSTDFSGWVSEHGSMCLCLSGRFRWGHQPDTVFSRTKQQEQKVHDGMGRKQDGLTPDQRRLAVSARPSLLEYLSYNLNFLSVLVGPCSNFHDYIDFIEGRHVWRKLAKSPRRSSLEPNGYGALPEPSPVRAVSQKLLVCIGCVVWFFVITRSFPITYNVDPHFLNQAPLLSRLGYAFISVQAARPKFYFAWTLADAIHNAAGYGISGVDDKGRVSWDLISNIHIWEIETATSFKTFIDNWNIQTGVWLKSVCYDRVPYYRTPLTFGLSALWHGVYPGYYFTFLTGIPITLAARSVRRNFRSYFLGSRAMKLTYDVVTWGATQFAICYTVMPFLLLAVEPTLTYYRSMYFHVHVISILAVTFLPGRDRSSKPANHVHHSNNNVKAE